MLIRIPKHAQEMAPGPQPESPSRNRTSASSFPSTMYVQHARGSPAHNVHVAKYLHCLLEAVVL